METNQTTQTTTTQQPAANKKMMACKTCGAQMAKSAKKCPSCGAKNGKAKMKKLIVLVAVILVAAIAISIASAPRKIGIGSAVEKGQVRMVLKDVQFEKTNYLIKSDTLKPIQKDDLQLGDSFVRSNEENVAAVVITVTAENIGKHDASFGPNTFCLNYNDGNRYYADNCYARNQKGEWTQFDEIELEKVTSGTVKVCVVAWLPEEIYDSPESLTLEFMGATYKIK